MIFLSYYVLLSLCRLLFNTNNNNKLFLIWHAWSSNELWHWEYRIEIPFWLYVSRSIIPFEMIKEGVSFQVKPTGFNVFKRNIYGSYCNCFVFVGILCTMKYGSTSQFMFSNMKFQTNIFSKSVTWGAQLTSYLKSPC